MSILISQIETRVTSRSPIATRSLCLLIAAACLFGAAPAVSCAGMPRPLPDDIELLLLLREEPAQRLQVISFFLVGLLLAAWAVKGIWNGLRREFPKLPRIAYGKSLLITIAWGLLFWIVLVMISGARELMTPGAWKKTAPPTNCGAMRQPRTRRMCHETSVGANTAVGRCRDGVFGVGPLRATGSFGFVWLAAVPASCTAEGHGPLGRRCGVLCRPGGFHLVATSDLRLAALGDERAHGVWRWRSTLLLVALLVTLFVAGVAMVGVTHQVAWLASDDQPLMTPALRPFKDESRMNLQRVGFAISNFHNDYHGLPTPAMKTPEEVEQSWVIRVLPFEGYYVDQFHFAKPWDHPDNQAVARKLVPILLNPGLRPPVLRDARGYGVSHYAGNVHVFEYPGRLTWDDISDGTANTLLVGEVAAGFQPWAKPRANRDPALGIDGSPRGFGGPQTEGGALFLVADGSVRFLSRHRPQGPQGVGYAQRRQVNEISNRKRVNRQSAAPAYKLSTSQHHA